MSGESRQNIDPSIIDVAVTAKEALALYASVPKRLGNISIATSEEVERSWKELEMANPTYAERIGAIHASQMRSRQELNALRQRDFDETGRYDRYGKFVDQATNLVGSIDNGYLIRDIIIGRMPIDSHLSYDFRALWQDFTCIINEMGGNQAFREAQSRQGHAGIMEVLLTSSVRLGPSPVANSET